jgi:hypothetical protein
MRRLDEAFPGLREQLRRARLPEVTSRSRPPRSRARAAASDIGNADAPAPGRLEPDAMSVTEAAEFQKNRTQLVDQARQIMEQARSRPTPRSSRKRAPLRIASSTR